jgi:hypothetical protein
MAENQKGKKFVTLLSALGLKSLNSTHTKLEKSSSPREAKTKKYSIEG